MKNILSDQSFASEFITTYVNYKKALEDRPVTLKRVESSGEMVSKKTLVTFS
jgi:hypothetical protein